MHNRESDAVDNVGIASGEADDNQASGIFGGMFGAVSVVQGFAEDM